LSFLQVKDDSITLSKSGSATVDIEQTIPKGCYYTDDEEPNCEERITFEDESSVPDMCTGKLRVQNIADVGNPFVKIKVTFKYVLHIFHIYLHIYTMYVFDEVMILML
jgi:hypothetical protein